MSRIRARPENGHLYFDFSYRGTRCREQTTLADTPVNRKRMQQVLEKIDAEIALGSFEYRRYFPSSETAAQFEATPPPGSGQRVLAPGQTAAPLFSAFAATWWSENEVRWRQGTKDSMKATVERLVKRFGQQPVSEITRSDILLFRAEMAKEKGRGGNATLSPKTVNQAITVLKAMLAEAADRHGFRDPAQRIERLKVPRKDIEPFTLDEVRKILATVRADYRPYLTVRVFTGMRTGEANGLKWKYIDWDRGQILIRETYTHGRVEYTKNDASQREIQMSATVREALLAQQKVTGAQDGYVFCTRDGGPLDAKNFANRVWAPLLRHLKLKQRRPYQMRHTCATLWLAAGENPEWIARQLGHSTTEMLFRVYSRYVPNLTRKDGSAFDRLLAAANNGGVASAEGSPPVAETAHD